MVEKNDSGSSTKRKGVMVVHDPNSGVEKEMEYNAVALVAKPGISCFSSGIDNSISIFYSIYYF